MFGAASGEKGKGSNEKNFLSLPHPSPCHPTLVILLTVPRRHFCCSCSFFLCTSVVLYLAFVSSVFVTRLFFFLCFWRTVLCDYGISFTYIFLWYVISAAVEWIQIRWQLVLERFGGGAGPGLVDVLSGYTDNLLYVSILDITTKFVIMTIRLSWNLRLRGNN